MINVTDLIVTGYGGQIVPIQDDLDEYSNNCELSTYNYNKDLIDKIFQELANKWSQDVWNMFQLTSVSKTTT